MAGKPARLFSVGLMLLSLVLAACGQQAAKPAAQAPQQNGAAPAQPAQPQEDAKAKAAAAVADFYKGKTVTILVGYSAGGGYDLYARALARHIGKYIPGNPTVIVQNMPGAGSLLAANNLFSVAPKDGTTFGVIARGAPQAELIASPEAKFKSTQMNWIGSMNEEVSVCVASAKSGITKFEDLFTKTLKVGGNGPGADTYTFPDFLNNILHTKFDMVSGYPGGNDINLALERGEVGGRCGWSYSSVKSTHPDWVKDGTVKILVQMAMHKHKELPDVPLVIDLAKDARQKQMFETVFARQTMGRPFVAPPGVPAERVAALRKAFLDTLADKDFLAEAEKAKMEITPVSGEEVQKIVEKMFQTPKEDIAELAKYLASSD